MHASAEEAGGVLTVDLNALADNYRDLRARAGRAECAAVVKGDGYGIGLVKAAQALAAAGCGTFFVALIEEARILRGALPTATIYVLNGLNPGTAGVFRALRVQPVLGSWPEIDEWDGFARDSDEPLPAAIHIDNGMRRHGLSPTDAITLSERIRLLSFKPSLVMGHLACADDPSHPMNARQIGEFRELAGRFQGIRLSLANSAGLLAFPESHLDLVRPGVALYGATAFVDGSQTLRPVVRLALRIVQVKQASRGEFVGYGAEHRLQRDSRLAVLSAGYADGIFRAAGASDRKRGAELVVAGKRCPVVGRISMDLLVIDVTDLPPGAVKRGDFATLIGDGITVDELAAHANTIGYEVLVQLGRRYARRYLGG